METTNCCFLDKSYIYWITQIFSTVEIIHYILLKTYLLVTLNKVFKWLFLINKLHLLNETYLQEVT
jgi:hypothetical protein